MEQLNAARIREMLDAAAPPVYVFDTLDSTSTECRRRLAAGEARCLVLAERQSAGRGRQGRSFFSPGGCGLYLSLLFCPRGGVASADAFTSWAAVSTARAIGSVTGRECGVKWVNDLWYGGKKVCGILTEAVGEKLIVGIGVNLRAGALPEELRDVAGALERDCDRDALAAEIVRGLLAYDPEDRGFFAEYRSRSVVLGRRVRCLINGEPYIGTAVGIADDGALLVESEHELRALHSGEISLLRPEMPENDDLFA